MGMYQSIIPGILMLIMLGLLGCQKTTRYVGTWQQGPDPNHGGVLNCTVKQIKDTKYKAHFHGTCGRAYSYRLTLDGYKNGEAVIFSGLADLGQADGGKYTWTGTLNGAEFNGGYENPEGGKGTFELQRKGPVVFDP